MFVELISKHLNGIKVTNCDLVPVDDNLLRVKKSFLDDIDIKCKTWFLLREQMSILWVQRDILPTFPAAVQSPTFNTHIQRYRHNFFFWLDQFLVFIGDTGTMPEPPFCLDQLGYSSNCTVCEIFFAYMMPFTFELESLQSKAAPGKKGEAAYSVVELEPEPVPWHFFAGAGAGSFCCRSWSRTKKKKSSSGFIHDILLTVTSSTFTIWQRIKIIF